MGEGRGLSGTGTGFSEEQVNMIVVIIREVSSVRGKVKQ